MDYYKALKNRKKVTTIPDGMPREFVVRAIAGITDQLKCPMGDAERIMLCQDRSNFRDILALMDTP